MEEDWDIIDSTSSDSIPVQEEEPRGLELNFNRFRPQVAYELSSSDECQDEDYDQQLMDEGVIFSDEGSQKEIVFTVGDSNLMKNDTTQQPIDEFDDDDTNNELEQQRIDQLKNNYLSRLFPSNIMDNPPPTVPAQENTRETDADRTAVWRNAATTGTSVPYVSAGPATTTAMIVAPTTTAMIVAPTTTDMIVAPATTTTITTTTNRKSPSIIIPNIYTHT